jgi:hypothetical protein
MGFLGRRISALRFPGCLLFRPSVELSLVDFTRLPLQYRKQSQNGCAKSLKSHHLVCSWVELGLINLCLGDPTYIPSAGLGCSNAFLRG